MADREKAVKGLNQHCEGSLFDRCGECPYYEIAGEPFQCRDELLRDVLKLLKEQEKKIKSLEQTIEDICCGGGAE